VINASGDQYFLPDNSRFYFLDMPDEKLLRYVPNAKHDMNGTDVRESMLAFYQSILHDTKRPSFSWKVRRDGSIVVKAGDEPLEANLWQATNPEARDFRLDTIGKAWTKSSLQGENGKFTAQVDTPENGYTAFFVEMVYDSGFDHPFKFTTDVSVVPDVLPFSLDGVTEIELK
jgi:PhoPQ-activated pathogenicity-related protein